MFIDCFAIVDTIDVVHTICDRIRLKICWRFNQIRSEEAFRTMWSCFSSLMLTDGVITILMLILLTFNRAVIHPDWRGAMPSLPKGICSSESQSKERSISMINPRFPLVNSVGIWGIVVMYWDGWYLLTVPAQIGTATSASRTILLVASWGQVINHSSASSSRMFWWVGSTRFPKKIKRRIRQQSPPWIPCAFLLNWGVNCHLSHLTRFLISAVARITTGSRAKRTINLFMTMFEQVWLNVTREMVWRTRRGWGERSKGLDILVWGKCVLHISVYLSHNIIVENLLTAPDPAGPYQLISRHRYDWKFYELLRTDEGWWGVMPIWNWRSWQSVMTWVIQELYSLRRSSNPIAKIISLYRVWAIRFLSCEFVSNPLFWEVLSEKDDEKMKWLFRWRRNSKHVTEQTIYI